MPIKASDVQVGGIYVTASNQERKVLEITEDGHVHYAARSANSSTWGPGANLSSPPTMETFVAACDRIVSLPKQA